MESFYSNFLETYAHAQYTFYFIRYKMYIMPYNIYDDIAFYIYVTTFASSLITNGLIKNSLFQIAERHTAIHGTRGKTS